MIGTELTLALRVASESADADLHEQRERANRARALATEAVAAQAEGETAEARILVNRAARLSEHYEALRDAIALSKGGVP